MRLSQLAAEISERRIRYVMTRHRRGSLGILITQKPAPKSTYIEENLREQVEPRSLLQKKCTQLLVALRPPPLLAAGCLLESQIEAIFLPRAGKNLNQPIVEDVQKIPQGHIALPNPLHHQFGIGPR